MVRDRKEEAVIGEKPCTMDPLRMMPSEDTEVSESRWSLWRAVLAVAVVVLFDKQESVESPRVLDSLSGSGSGLGVDRGWGRGTRGRAPRLASREGDKGHIEGFSCILTTIFSSVRGVRCRDLERELAQPSWPKDLDLVLMGHDPSSLILDSDERELLREGTWLDLASGESIGATHSDSRDHTLQLMFSNRGPSFSVPEHFEKMDHIAIRLPALEGSIWCILAASSRRTGAFKVDGMLGRGDIGRAGEEQVGKGPQVHRWPCHLK